MSLGKRRFKAPRAQLRPPASPLDLRSDRAARRRFRLLRFALLTATVALTAVIIYGTGPAFTYRVGLVPTREIRVSVPAFQVHNQRKTIAALQRAADEVKPILDNDPAPIRELAERLADLAEAVSRVPDREALPENLRSSWKIDGPTFDELRTATDTPERRHDLRERIARAFAPIARYGILGPDALPQQEESAVAVQVRNGTDVIAFVPFDRIRPERVIKTDGAVAQDFIKSFTSATLGQKLFALVAEKLAGAPTLTYNERVTGAARKAARQNVKDVYDPYQRGDLLIEQDRPLTDDDIEVLRKEHAQAVANMSWSARLRRALAVFGLVASLFALIGYYIQRHESRIAGSMRQILTLCGLAAGTVAIARLLALQPWDAEVIPVAVTGMILAIAVNPHFALMVSFALSLMVTMALGQGIGYFIVLMGGTAAGILPLDDVRSRSKPIQVGIYAALGYFLLTWATGLWQNQPLQLVAFDSVWRAGWGLMAGFFLGGVLPFVESAFGIVTGISLLELADISHPLLQELVRRAPGTHNHSVSVGTIAEAAAERIGANALLLRVGAYFHDIGKMLKPHYFIENQMGAPNRHANLAPAMSTLIIIGHVKDGVELARQHNLPEPIVDLIEQHHGTTLVEYFYREAKSRSECAADAAHVSESSFRYPGPRPQTREAGILMMADAVESASRTLSDPTPARIEGLVSALVEKRVDDGQFDECGLTLRDIAEVRDSLTKSLIGIYHGRVKYPEQKTA